VTSDARALREDRLAVCGRARGRLRRLDLLRGDPSRERIGRIDDDAHAHVGVRDAAELGALAGDIRPESRR